MLARCLARHRHHLSRRPPRAMDLANVQPLLREMAPIIQMAPIIAPMLQQLQRLQKLQGDWPFATTLDATGAECGTPETLPNTLSGLRESDSKYHVLITAPGIKPEDISVTVSKGIVRVKGETKGERDGWEFCNRIEESIQLPASSIDEEGVTATTDHGVLSVIIPKLSKADDMAAVRMIPVRPATAEIEGKSAAVEIEGK